MLEGRVLFSEALWTSPDDENQIKMAVRYVPFAWDPVMTETNSLDF
jgi:hypothetical protein